MQREFIAIGELDLVELDVRALGAEQARLEGFGHGAFRGEQRKGPLAGGARLDNLILQSRQIFQRLIHGEDGANQLQEIRGVGAGLRMVD